MLKSVKYCGVYQDWSGYDYYSYEIIDDSFRESFRINYRGRAHLVRNVVEIYSRRSLNVPKNVAIFYITLFSNLTLKADIDTLREALRKDNEYIYAVYPELQYGKLYARCVERHINSLLWTKGA